MLEWLLGVRRGEVFFGSFGGIFGNRDGGFGVD